MALKRKFSTEFDDVAPTNGKQQKLIPFPNSDLDSDVAMSDASDLEPLSIPSHPFHIRLPSDASYASSTCSDSPRNSPFYPAFDLYPPEADSYMSVSAHGFPDATINVPQKPVGLIQPKGNGFTHHGCVSLSRTCLISCADAKYYTRLWDIANGIAFSQNCTQIPKLRMACSAGPNGRRSMWAHCEECGAIEMVNND
ncbi:hypothetical protein C8Q74DRAFT_732331 [Fomes fomentarius]|nr:hypothetical protein C8Q74DRAFT_732331 [Fomes fomentarius]